MQRSLRSLLSEDAADITGLMSGKVKYYVGNTFSKADSSVHEAFRKVGHTLYLFSSKFDLSSSVPLK